MLRYTLSQNDYKIIDSQVDQLKPKHEQFEGKVHIELDRSGIVVVKGVDLIETFQEEEKEGEEVKVKTKTQTSSSHYLVEKFFGLAQGDIQNFAKEESQIM
jgi:hypothetical protein